MVPRLADIAASGTIHIVEHATTYAASRRRGIECIDAAATNARPVAAGMTGFAR
jgi:hypothetical protein